MILIKIILTSQTRMRIPAQCNKCTNIFGDFDTVFKSTKILARIQTLELPTHIKRPEWWSSLCFNHISLFTTVATYWLPITYWGTMGLPGPLFSWVRRALEDVWVQKSRHTASLTALRYQGWPRKFNFLFFSREKGMGSDPLIKSLLFPLHDES